MDASKTALGHANVEISTNATANIKYLYYYVSKGEDRNVTSIRRKEADQASDEVGRPAAHGSPPTPNLSLPDAHTHRTRGRSRSTSTSASTTVKARPARVARTCPASPRRRARPSPRSAQRR